jgi:hypothetical protein
MQKATELVENISSQSNGLYISADSARRKANGYLTASVSLFVKADNPLFIPAAPPRWRMTTFLRLRGHGRVATIGFIDVNAQTREVVALTETQIEEMKGRAQDAVASIEFSTAAAS